MKSNNESAGSVWLSREAKALVGIGLATALVLGAVFYLLGRSDSTETSTAPAADLVREDSYKITDPAAKVTIVEFLDLECEACAAAYPTVKRILSDYEGRVNFVVRNLPNHNNSVLAAKAAEAAGAQGKFWEMQDTLFNKQSEWGEKRQPQTELFVQYATSIGLNADQFRADMEGDRFSAKISRDKQDALSMGLEATPTFFINGVKVVGGLPYSQFAQKIEAALTAAN